MVNKITVTKTVSLMGLLLAILLSLSFVSCEGLDEVLEENVAENNTVVENTSDQNNDEPNTSSDQNDSDLVDNPGGFAQATFQTCANLSRGQFSTSRLDQIKQAYLADLKDNETLRADNTYGICPGISYPSVETSKHILPYHPNESDAPFWCTQGNCAPADDTHTVSRNQQYAYDFLMDTGTCLQATRAGRVIEAIDSNPDHSTSGYYQTGADNVLAIEHEDKSITYYKHLMQGGIMVNVGDVVLQGQAIARSGFSGNASAPHLHFEVKDAAGNASPITFRNAKNKASGQLEAGPIKCIYGSISRWSDTDAISYSAEDTPLNHESYSNSALAKINK